MKNIWQRLPRPFFALAPLEDVTDTVFRRIIASCGRPDVFFTEFTNTDALFSPGEKSAMQRLTYTEEERPIIAQIWGIHPENFYKASERIVTLGFDGIDINMGCPEKSVVKHGACSGLIKNPTLAKEIIKATREGSKGKLPLSVKTRIGLLDITIQEWIGFLLSQNLDALTVHLRTAKEMSDVPAHWEEMGSITSLRDKLSPQTVIIGNGDVLSREEGIEKANRFRIEGVMIGRGVFRNPFVFSQRRNWEQVKVEDKLALLLKHVALYDKTWQGSKKYNVLKKFYKIYTSGFTNASDLRMKLMETKSPDEVISIVQNFLHAD